MGPRTITEALDCANEALRQERDDAREQADTMRTMCANVLEELGRMLGMNDLATIKTSLQELRDEMEGNLTRGAYRV